MLLLNVTEQWKQGMGKKEYIGTVLIHVINAFDCLPHELLTLFSQLTDSFCRPAHFWSVIFTTDVKGYKGGVTWYKI